MEKKIYSQIEEILKDQNDSDIDEGNKNFILELCKKELMICNDFNEVEKFLTRLIKRFPKLTRKLLDIKIDD